MKKMAFTFMYPPLAGHRASAGLLAMRLVLGVGIILHGWPKLADVSGFAGAVGVPTFMGWLAVLSEIVGGAMILIGLLTPVFGALLVGTMAYAILFHMRQGDPFIASGGGGSWELAAVYLVGFLTLVLAGPGRFALDTTVFGKWLRW